MALSQNHQRQVMSKRWNDVRWNDFVLYNVCKVKTVHKLGNCFVFTLYGENDDLQDEITILNGITIVQIL